MVSIGSFYRVKVSRTGKQKQLKLPTKLSEYPNIIKMECIYNPQSDEIFFLVKEGKDIDKSIYNHLEEWFKEQVLKQNSTK